MEDMRCGYTRVSTILAQWDTYGKIDKKVLQNKADIGTRVHESIKNHLECIYTPLKESETGYFDSYILWENQIKPKLVASEKRYYCDKMMITGQIDALMLLEGDEKPVLIDYKTSVSENKYIWQLQACFYHYLMSQSGVCPSEKVTFLKLDKDGHFPKVCEYTITKQLWSICASAYNCYRYFNS